MTRKNETICKNPPKLSGFVLSLPRILLRHQDAVITPGPNLFIGTGAAGGRVWGASLQDKSQQTVGVMKRIMVGNSKENVGLVLKQIFLQSDSWL